MKTYIADIIPKINRFSKKLDDLTLLIDQHWVVLDDTKQSKVVYIFRSNGNLIISTNGKVEKAKWEYLGQNSLLVDLKDQSYLFKHGFFDKNILALKIDNNGEYLILINESKYQKELNSLSAITRFLNNEYLENSLPKKKSRNIVYFNYKKSGFSLKMGKYDEFFIGFNNGQTFNVFHKASTGQYYFTRKMKSFFFQINKHV